MQLRKASAVLGNTIKKGRPTSACSGRAGASLSTNERERVGSIYLDQRLVCFSRAAPARKQILSLRGGKTTTNDCGRALRQRHLTLRGLRLAVRIDVVALLSQREPTASSVSCKSFTKFESCMKAPTAGSARRLRKCKRASYRLS